MQRLPYASGMEETLVYQPSGTPVYPGTMPVWTDAPHPVLWDFYAAGRAIRRRPPDVLFAPKSFLPRGVPASVRQVALILDLVYFPLHGVYLNEYRASDVAYVRLFYRASCRRAHHLVCISEQTRSDLLDICRIPPERTSVVYPGVSIPSSEALAPERIVAVREKYNLSNPYIFYPGSLSPRKNIVRGLRAFAQIAGNFPHEWVVTGGKSWKDSDVSAEVDRLGLQTRFRRLGAVDATELPALYAGASALFFPSLYEGFGLPLLEAMACRCPVVAARASALPEVAGDAAEWADPQSEDDLARALRCVLENPARADQLRAAGLLRAREFTWEKTVAGLLRAFERAMAS